jgi:glycosyltransferase involved in cell wall biosynthesis
LLPGNHIISSYGYANASFRWVRKHGGKTLVDAGNSHPENFWSVLTEEHRRWNCRNPPVARTYYERACEMMADVDYVLCPSSFVRRSYLERGFKPEQILRNVYPVDLTRFKPATEPRPKDRPLTIISTGALSLRKGAPYMLEAFQMVNQRHPSARFRLSRIIQDSAMPAVEKYKDLPIDWAPALPHAQLAERLQSSDIFVLPSLEEGLVRTALEAMACGLPVILTPNTGTADFVQPGINGEIVPVRDPQAIADAIIKWGDKIISSGERPVIPFVSDTFSFETFEREFISQLKGIGLA